MIEFDGNTRSFDSTPHHWKFVVANRSSDDADQLSDVLRLLGHDVLRVCDGADAIAVHETFKPDAYFLHLGMPGLAGFETCSALRKLPGGDAVAIIALSCWGRLHDETRTMEAGFSSVLHTPARPREIVRCLSCIPSRTARQNAFVQRPASNPSRTRNVRRLIRQYFFRA